MVLDRALQGFMRRACGGGEFISSGIDRPGPQRPEIENWGRTMLRAIAFVVTFAGLGSCPLFAADLVLESPLRQVTLLELYTSEGCSSCPPADRWLSKLRDDPRLWEQVVPIAFHVDYWDYIGWEDRLASAEHGRRQRDYAREGNVKTVYTPGLILGGQEWRGWFSRPVLELGDQEEVGRLSLDLANRQGTAVFVPVEGTGKPLELHVAVLGFGLETEVRAGENRGRKLIHDFAVLDYRRVATEVDGIEYRGSFLLSDPKIESERRAIALWVSPIGHPRPIQALGGWLN